MIHSVRHMSHVPATAQQQRGVTLAVTLIFLLILTIIGVTSMRTATLQEKMAGNSRDMDVALQAAESSTLYGEKTVGLMSASDPEGLKTCATPPTNGIWCADTVEIDNASWWTANGVNYNGDGTKQIDQAYEDPRHAVEFMQKTTQGGSADPTATSYVYYWRVTARGRGASGETTAVVQTYVRGTFN